MSVLTNKSKQHNLILQMNPSSHISEEYRTLRTNLTFSSVDTELKKILVTSSIPGEGKTTTLANLAVSYAQENRKVLMIDADLRNPSLHQFFLKSNRIGLTSLLANKNSAPDIILDTDIPNLSIIPSGPVPPNPSELLSSMRMQALLEKLVDEFDVILIDSPPALAVTDPQILSTMCDGVLFVVNHGKVKRQFAKKAIAKIEQVKAKILGVVINNKPNKKSETFYYN
ncbi:CpsD/CapB family tyrosine-protein kinase [Paenibacillus hexagrammi]|uniref:non-specific protein-tyrosine kinase n=1 Tax=Paenibacillus hexagrammi TaxID=2908839 RepID=A0ABY3SMH2_9BACL|nr:CpsD/CapB family tyrosine-protein kinase [Paenibacillus sp. YPD9-1]UJF34315.1 CpsD/CapB family tyrosine-protein kinase [Paenibacillus sp. YPD9-1]